MLVSCESHADDFLEIKKKLLVDIICIHVVVIPHP